MGDNEAAKMVMQSAMVSQKIREALQASLPVAPEQLMTVQIPGIIIDTSETGPYVWNNREQSDTPHRIKVNEARLVDNMVPLSKVMMGITGKSVSRSYAAALDMLIPEDAPIDTKSSGGTRTAAAERYVVAMNYLTGIAPGSSKSIIDLYVAKQDAYSEAMNLWELAKSKTRATAMDRFPSNIRDQQKHFDDWNQENFRGFKDRAQAKYMDWVVNGNKYKVDYYFGIVDVSSAMKRVEGSKEAARNLVVIDPDGSTEWQEVHLTPSNWASICREKVVQWQTRNKSLSRKDFESEIKRLNRLLRSYTGLHGSIESSSSGQDGNNQDEKDKKQLTKDENQLAIDKTKLADDEGKPANDNTKPTHEKLAGEKTRLAKEETRLAGERTRLADGKGLLGDEKTLAEAYKGLYEAHSSMDPDPVLTREKQDILHKALEDNGKANLEKIKGAVREFSEGSKTQKLQWVKAMIDDVDGQIVLLKERLQSFDKASTPSPAITEVVIRVVGDPGQTTPGKLVSTQYAETDDQYARTKFEIPRKGVAVVQPGNEEPDKWTKISLSVSSESQSSEDKSASSTTSASAGGSGWWLWNASLNANHSAASKSASKAISNCSVDVTFEALLVTIDRAWLHGELFADPELNTADGIDLSPGALALHQYIDQKNSTELSKYPYFPSYPTSFVVASNIELEIHGDTTNLEEAIESSHTDAQTKVGWGPFSLSASHSQDKSSAKTKMETTATGTKITLEAPAILGWVSQLVPQLPRPKGENFLKGPLI